MEDSLKGDVTELEAILAFKRLGYTVSIPYGNHDKYDFAVDINGRLYRIQCKTAALFRDNNALIIDARRKQYVNGKRQYYPYDKTDVDFLCTTWNGECYLLPVEECNSRKALRLRVTKRAESAQFNWAEDYLLENILKSLIGENRG